MALTLSIAKTSPGSIVAGQSMNFTVAVTNTGAAAVSLSSLAVNESTESDAQIAQPNFMTPNVPVGVGNPVLNAGATSTFPFQVVFNSPYLAGPSPNNPGGAAPGPAAANPDAQFTLQAQAQASDGSIASTSLLVPVLSAIAPFPLAQGGAFQFGQGFNFINGLMLYAL